MRKIFIVAHTEPIPLHYHLAAEPAPVVIQRDQVAELLVEVTDTGLAPVVEEVTKSGLPEVFAALSRAEEQDKEGSQ